MADESDNSTMRKILLIFNCILLFVGNTGAPLIMRLYFIHGGKRIWFSSFLQTAGFPLFLVPLAVAYYSRRRKTTTTKVFFMRARIFLASTILGFLTGVDNYLFSQALSRLPVSTTSLIVSSQLAFTAIFAYLLVKYKFTSYSVNAIVLLTLGAVVLGLRTDSDRPPGVTGREYAVGFGLTVLATALYGLILPLVEFMYLKGKQVITYTLVMEIQLVMCLSATVFCTIGMLVNNDFQAISREAKSYTIGETKYYLVIIWTVIILQCFFLGVVGVINYSSSLLSGIIIAVTLPITQLLAVLFYHEKFQEEKGIALFLSLWGFASYFYGEMKFKKKDNENVVVNRETEMIDVDQVVVVR